MEFFPGEIDLDYISDEHPVESVKYRPRCLYTNVVFKYSKHGKNGVGRSQHIGLGPTGQDRLGWHVIPKSQRALASYWMALIADADTSMEIRMMGLDILQTQCEAEKLAEFLLRKYASVDLRDEIELFRRYPRGWYLGRSRSMIEMIERKRVGVTSPYHAGFITTIKQIRGRQWKQGRRVWTLFREDRDKVITAIRLHFAGGVLFDHDEAVKDSSGRIVAQIIQPLPANHPLVVHRDVPIFALKNDEQSLLDNMLPVESPDP